MAAKRKTVARDACLRGGAAAKLGHHSMMRICLIAIFAAASWLRFRMPPLPLGTPDTWGYLFPALSGLAGEGMPETNARGIAYPLFLRIVLGATGNFPSVVFVQHLLGLLSGVLWWISWNLWTEWLPERMKTPARWCGMAGLALYLCNAGTIFYESTLRPEGIFPFFALSGIAATWMFVRARWANPSPAAAPWGMLAVLFPLICLSLKPGWGLAALVPVIIVCASLVGKFPPLWRFATVILCVLAAAFWIFVVPPAAQWKPDGRSRLFLPETLFVQHAPAIAKAMASRDAREGLKDDEKKFLSKLQQRLEESQTTRLEGFRSLGHNPDYLLYDSDTLSDLPWGNDPAARYSFLWNSYVNAWKKQPGAMCGKIAFQFIRSFGMAQKSLYAPETNWRNHLQKSIEVLQLNKPAVPASALHLGYEPMIEATKEHLSSAPKKLRMGPPFMSPVARIVGSLLVAGCMVMWPLFFARATLRRSSPATGAIITFGIFWGLSFGSSLTIAAVSSFDITRYAALQSFLHAFLLGGTLLVIFEGARALFNAKHSP